MLGSEGAKHSGNRDEAASRLCITRVLIYVAHQPKINVNSVVPHDTSLLFYMTSPLSHTAIVFILVLTTAYEVDKLGPL